MLSPLVPAVGISVEPVCISAQESIKKKKKKGARMHTTLQVNYVEIIGSYFFLHIIICFHSFILAEYVEHL